MSQLSLEEKAALTIGSDFWHTAAVERLGLGRIMVADGPHGLRAQLDEADHIGLSGSVPATCFPTASGLGSSWDPGLFRSVGSAIAREARRWGVSVVLGPGVNMKRSPLCGRNFEYVSEDPWLAGELAAAMVEGIQSQGVGASVKHFAANNQEDDRLRVSAEVDERTLREIYLPAFETVVKRSRPWTVMCAYNKVNGVYASEHHWLLTEVLRDEWGFDGIVVSDWGAVHDRVAALAGGLDLEMPPNLGVSDAAVVAAVRDGSLPPATLDRTVSRLLELLRRVQPALREPGDVDAEEHHELARRAARESAVLLRNVDDVLPLRAAPGTTVAVIGEFARTPRYQGAGSSQVTPTRLDTALDALVAGLGLEVDVVFEPGFEVGDTGRDAELRAARDVELRAAAVETVAAADHVVVFLGLPAAAESEGFDRTHIDLPANQVALVHALADVHDQVIVVLANGSTVRLSTWEDRVDAILECWLSGQAGGGAVADLLLGVASPSGKLAETVPLRLEDNSSYLNFPGEDGLVRYGEGLFIGYRGFDRQDQAVSYPFGFGLSYTTFAVQDVAVEVRGSVAVGDLDVGVTARVTNIGSVPGAEVVQVYVADLVSTVARPVRELKGFQKVALEPGESQQVRLRLDERSFAFWSSRWGRWVVEAGEFSVDVGTSSRDLVESVLVTLAAPSIAAPLTTDSTLHEWLADEKGRALLTANGGVGQLSDEALVKVVGSMPMRTLAAFPGTPLTREGLESIAGQV